MTRQPLQKLASHIKAKAVSAPTSTANYGTQRPGCSPRGLELTRLLEVSSEMEKQAYAQRKQSGTLLEGAIRSVWKRLSPLTAPVR